MATSKKAVVVIGTGDATGGAIARRFAREGYIACVTRRHPEKLTPLVEQIRSEGGEAYAFGSDARKEEAMVALFQEIEANIAPVEAAIFNIGANVHLQHSRRNRAHVLQDLGDGLLRCLPLWP